MGKLQGKVAIITGAGGGIGRGMSVAFAKEGAKIVVADINKETARATETEVKKAGGQALVVVCDIGKTADCKRLVDEAVKAFGTVDILVNNAQSKSVFVSTELIEEEWWDNTFNTGPKAAFLLSRACFPYMKDKGGKVINFGSGIGISGNAEGSYAAYGAAKEAMRGFTRCAARDWGKYSINVNTICPAAMTPRMAEAWKKYPPEVEKNVLSRAALARWGDPERDIGRAAVFLASEDSDYITGHTLMVDGGIYML